VFSLLVTVLAFGGAAMAGRDRAGWIGLLGMGVLAVGIALAAVAYGLWTRQPWAPKLTLYTYWVSAGLGVIALLYDRTAGNIALQVVGIVIDLIVIRYIRKPEVIALYTAS
jgi:hypothetical protein